MEGNANAIVNTSPDAVSVEPREGYTLWIAFENGEEGLLDLTNDVGHPKLRDLETFRKAKIGDPDEDGCTGLLWRGIYDTPGFGGYVGPGYDCYDWSPDALYYRVIVNGGQPLEEEVSVETYYKRIREALARHEGRRVGIPSWLGGSEEAAEEGALLGVDYESPRPVSVEPREGYTLWIAFENGEEGLLDLTYDRVHPKLRDLETFRKARIGNRDEDSRVGLLWREIYPPGFYGYDEPGQDCYEWRTDALYYRVILNGGLPVEEKISPETLYERIRAAVARHQRRRTSG